MRWLLPLALVLAVAATTVEEVLAVVGGTPLLASDVALARQFALVSPDPDETAADYDSRLLEARIRLELQYRHLEDTGVLYRLTVEADATAERLLSRLGPDGEERLRRMGLDRDDVDALAVRLAATTAYVDQRLRARIQLTAAEVEAEARRRLGDAPGEPVDPSADDLTDHVRRLLFERRLNAEVERWLEQARERVEVVRLAP